MELSRQAFSFDYDGHTITGKVKRASGTDRSLFIAENKDATERAKNGDDGALRHLHSDDICRSLEALDADGGPVTVDSVSWVEVAKSGSESDQNAWVDMLPDGIRAGIIGARYGFNRPVGNSKPTPEES